MLHIMYMMIYYYWLKTTQPRTGGAVTVVTNCRANCVETDLLFLLESRPCGPAGWLALLPIKEGDLETIPDPTTTHKQVLIYDICHNQIHGRKQISIRCNRHPPSTTYRYLDLPSPQTIWTHTERTPPHPPRPWSKPLPTPHLHHPKHRHTSNTPPVPAELVKPKPNPLIHSPPSSHVALS